MNDYAKTRQAELQSLEATVERSTGFKAETLRRMTVDEFRRVVEKQHCQTMRFQRHFPYIGRGNILGDRTKSRDEIDQMLDEALR